MGPKSILAEDNIQAKNVNSALFYPPLTQDFCERWLKRTQKIPLRTIERAWKNINKVYKKHMELPDEKKRASDGKHYTIIPLHLAKNLQSDYILDRIKKEKIPDKDIDSYTAKCRDFLTTNFTSAVIECTGRFINTIALPILRINYDKKRCPIESCHKKREEKSKDCFIQAKRIRAERVISLPNKKDSRLLIARICTSTNEPYLIEFIPRMLIMKNIEQNFHFYVCPYCECDKINRFSMKPKDPNSVLFITVNFNSDLLLTNLFCNSDKCKKCFGSRDYEDCPVFKNTSLSKENISYKIPITCLQCGLEFTVHFVSENLYEKIKQRKTTKSKRKII